MKVTMEEVMSAYDILNRIRLLGIGLKTMPSKEILGRFAAHSKDGLYDDLNNTDYDALVSDMEKYASDMDNKLYIGLNDIVKSSEAYVASVEACVKQMQSVKLGDLQAGYNDIVNKYYSKESSDEFDEDVLDEPDDDPSDLPDA